MQRILFRRGNVFLSLKNLIGEQTPPPPSNKKYYTKARICNFVNLAGPYDNPIMTHRPARLHSLEELIPWYSLELILELKCLQFRALMSKRTRIKTLVVKEKEQLKEVFTVLHCSTSLVFMQSLGGMNRQNRSN